MSVKRPYIDPLALSEDEIAAVFDREQEREAKERAEALRTREEGDCLVCEAPYFANSPGAEDGLCDEHQIKKPTFEQVQSSLDMVARKRQEKFLETNPPEKWLRDHGASQRHAEEASLLHEDKLRETFGALGDPRGAFFLHGPVGGGKTLWAVAYTWDLAKRWKRHKRDFRFWNVTDMLSDIQRGYKIEGGNVVSIDQSLGQTIEANMKADFLVLDDLGAEKPTEWALTTLYRIIDYRYREILPTVITSNLTLSRLSQRLGSNRVADRIGGWCKVIQISAENARD